MCSRHRTREKGFTVKKLHNRRGGFTLIELMIVVAIIGILAAIAIPNFLKFQLKAKTSEGKTNLAAIRTAEESVFAEFGNYVSANASPAAYGGTTKVAFVNVDGANQGFDLIGWTPEGRVYFNYGVAIAAAGFTANANADIDGDMTSQQWGYKKQNAGADVASKSLGGSPATCAVGTLVPETVGPCVLANGRSIF
jgi:type IV pilus assembly protein PilA